MLDLVATERDMWAVGNAGTVTKITNGERLDAAPPVRISGVSQWLPSAAGSGSLWVCDEVSSQLVRVDGGTGRIRGRLPIPSAGRDPEDPTLGVLAGRRSVWIVDYKLGGAVLRVDPATDHIVPYPVPPDERTEMTAAVAAPPAKGRGG